MCVCVYVCMCVCMYVCRCMYVCVCVFSSALSPPPPLSLSILIKNPNVDIGLGTFPGLRERSYYCRNDTTVRLVRPRGYVGELL